MQLSPTQLNGQLNKGIQPVYFIAGDEILLVNEARNSIKKAAQESGFTEIERFDIDPSTKWRDVFTAMNSKSLFAQRKMIEVSLRTRAFDNASIKALCYYIEHPNKDCVVIIRAQNFEWQDRNRAWFKALSKAVVVIYDRVPLSRIPSWLEHRAKRMELNITRSATERLADCVEGNLLAAQQELEKLQLVFDDKHDEITEDDLSLVDSSFGNIFELIDCAFKGNVKRVQKLVATLRSERIHPIPVLSAFAAQLRRAYAWSQGKHAKTSKSRVSIFEAVVQRHRLSGLRHLLAECAFIDQQIKGGLRGDAWDSLENLLVSVAGLTESSLDRHYRWLRIDYEIN